MIPHLLFLQYLLFLNLTVDNAVQQIATECFALKFDKAPYNRVCGTATITPDEVKRVVAYFKGQSFSWFVDATHIHLHDILQQHGLQYMRSFTAMHIHLQDLHPPISFSKDIEIRAISPADTKDLMIWNTLAAHKEGVQVADAAYFTAQLLAVGPQEIKLYIGYYQNQPITCCMAVYYNNNIVHLDCIGTLPQYRRKGLGAMITYKALIDAQSRNYTQAILLASDMGKPMYEKIGFKQYALYKQYTYQ